MIKLAIVHIRRAIDTGQMKPEEPTVPNENAIDTSHSNKSSSDSGNKEEYLTIFECILPLEESHDILRLIRDQLEMECHYFPNDHIDPGVYATGSWVLFNDKHPKNTETDIDRMINHDKPIGPETLASLRLRQSFIDTRFKRTHYHLTHREVQIIQLISKGFCDKEIAYRFNISIYTVRSHIRNLYSKLGVKNRTEALRIFMALDQH